jgi:hypothetical protein
MSVQIREYIENQRKKNFSDNQIKQALIGAGYDSILINDCLNNYSTSINELTKEEFKENNILNGNNFQINKEDIKDVGGGVINNNPPIFEEKVVELDNQNNYIDRLIGFVKNYEMSYFKVILLILITSFLVGIGFFLYLNYLEEIIIKSLDIFNYSDNNPIFAIDPIYMLDDIFFFTKLNIINIIILFVIVFILKLLETIYLLIIKFIFLKEIKFIEIIKYNSIYSFFFMFFLYISFLYNFLFLKIFNSWSIIAIFGFINLGLILQYLFVTKTISMNGVSIKKSFFVLTLNWLVVIILIFLELYILINDHSAILLRFM